MEKVKRRHLLRVKSALEYLNKNKITLKEVNHLLNIKKKSSRKINVPTLLDRQFKDALDRDI